MAERQLNGIVQVACRQLDRVFRGVSCASSASVAAVTRGHCAVLPEGSWFEHQPQSRALGTLLGSVSQQHPC